MRNRSKSSKAATRLTADLMLAPAVVAMRLPLLAAELASNGARAETLRAGQEKATAMMDGLVAAQMSLAVSASRFWFEAMSGRTPSLLSGEAAERALHAALAPAGKAVRQNHGRLSRRRRSV